MLGMKEFHISASEVIQGHHGPLVIFFPDCFKGAVHFFLSLDLYLCNYLGFDLTLYHTVLTFNNPEGGGF